MAACHPLPRCWLFTDARAQGHGLAAARRLPPGGGIVLRSDDLPPAARRALLRRLRTVAVARRLILLVAGVNPDTARRLGAHGVHLRDRSARRAAQARRLGLITSAPVHDAAEARAARLARMALSFVSPLHPTLSHPGAPALGRRRWLALARQAGGKPVALGGMTAARHRALCRVAGPAIGSAAITAWDKAVQRKTGRGFRP